MDFAPYQDVYSNLLASATWAVGTRVAAAAADQAGDGRDDVSRIFDVAREKVVGLAAPTAIDGDIGGERLRAFLLSPEARDVAVGLAIAAVVGSEALKASLLRRFLATMSWYTALPERQIEPAAKRLFDAVNDSMEGAAEALRAALGESYLGGMALSHIAEEMGTAATSFAGLLGSAQAPDFDSAFDFERKYRSVVRSLYGRLEPPNYEGATIAVEDLYVEPRFRVLQSETHNLRVLDAAALRSSIHRTVILGSPGAGKSSFARSVCYQLVRDSLDGCVGLDATPFLIELRDFAVRKNQHDDGLSIVEYLEQLARVTFQTPPPPGAIEYLLASGRALVVFDGLDELTDTQNRRAIRDDVDAFASLYPCTRLLVTSRERGYREAPLDDRRFSTASILDFDEDQVTQYVANWFKITRRVRHTELEDLIAAFSEESASAGDLASNPLMLALMCSIYKRRNHLPRNRAAIYEQCAEMLFDRWDSSRNIQVDRPVDGHLIPLLQYVAHWIFEDPALQAGVTARQLEAHAAEYFRQELTTDPNEARSMARRFVKYCHGRGWVLVAIARSSDDEEIYEFAHRTFLEFFTAGWYAGSDGSVEDLLELLLPRVQAGEWEIVSLLAVQIRNRVARNSATQVVARAIAHAEQRESPAEQANVLAFAVRIYEFHVPRPEVTQALGEAAARNYVAVALGKPKLDQAFGEALASDNVLRRLLELRDGREYAITGIVSGLADVTVGADANARVVAADYALNLKFRARLTGMGFDVDEAAAAHLASRFWEVMGKELLSQAREHLELALVMQKAGHMDTDEVIERYGVSWLFRDLNLHGGISGGAAAYAEHLLAHVISAGDTVWNPHDLEQELSAIGDALVASPLPWVDPYEPAAAWFAHRPDVEPAGSDGLSPNALASALLLGIVVAQRMEPHELRRLTKGISERTDQLSPVWNAWLSDKSVADLGASSKLTSLLQAVASNSERTVGSLVPKTLSASHPDFELDTGF